MRAGLEVRALLATAALLSACSTGSEPSGGPGLNVLSGAGTTDTIGAEPRSPLVIRVLDDAGRPLAGEYLVLESRDCPIYVYCSIYVTAVGDSFWSTRHLDSTDTDGYARFRIKLGIRAGEARLRITALDAQSSAQQVVAATWTVAPGRVAAIAPAPRDTALYADHSYAAVATTYDRGGNRRTGDPVSFARVDGPIEVTGGTVRATGIGRGRLVARTGAVVDTAWVSVVPQGELALSTYADNGDVLTVQLDGSEPTTVASAGFYRGGRPAWVGAGPSLVFVQDSTGGGGVLRVSDGAGGSHRLAPSSAAIEEQVPRVSRDGAWTYFQYTGPPATGIELWRVHLDGTGLERIGAAGDPDHADLEPDPSPDGSRLAYGTSRPDGTWHVIMRDLATGTDHPVGVIGRLPRWSPSGDRIAYWNTLDGYNGTIHVVQADGSGDRLVSAQGVVYAEAGLDWSPDGAWLAARSEHTIDLIEVATGQTLPLPWSAPYAWAAWRP